MQFTYFLGDTSQQKDGQVAKLALKGISTNTQTLPAADPRTATASEDHH